MVSGISAAWYCISIFFKSTDMPSQMLYRGPHLCWSLLFLSDCCIYWECSQTVNQKLCRWCRQPPHAKKKKNKNPTSSQTLWKRWPHYCTTISIFNLAIIAPVIPDAVRSTSSSPVSHPSLIQSGIIWSQRGLARLLSLTRPARACTQHTTHQWSRRRRTCVHLPSHLHSKYARELEAQIRASNI